MKQVENKELFMPVTQAAGRRVTKSRRGRVAVSSPLAIFLSLVLVLVLSTFIAAGGVMRLRQPKMMGRVY